MARQRQLSSELLSGFLNMGCRYFHPEFERSIEKQPFIAADLCQLGRLICCIQTLT